jgi:hypothetical protein
MNNDSRRVTLICRSASAPSHSWRTGADSPTRNIVLHAFPVLSFALHNGIGELQQDVHRVVIDRVTTSDGFLELLTSLPAGFSGDILFIRDDANGYLSAMGRGGDRVLYALREADVNFYLETHELTRGYAVPQSRVA